MMSSKAGHIPSPPDVAYIECDVRNAIVEYYENLSQYPYGEIAKIAWKSTRRHADLEDETQFKALLAVHCNHHIKPLCMISLSTDSPTSHIITAAWEAACNAAVAGYIKHYSNEVQILVRQLEDEAFPEGFDFSSESIYSVCVHGLTHRICTVSVTSLTDED